MPCTVCILCLSNLPSNLIKYCFTLIDWKTEVYKRLSILPKVCLKITVLVNGRAGIGTQGNQTAEHTLNH